VLLQKSNAPPAKSTLLPQLPVVAVAHRSG